MRVAELFDMAPIPPTTKATSKDTPEALSLGKMRGKKRALLVGICYKGAVEWPELEGPWHDVRKMRELLLGAFVSFALDTLS